MLVVALLAGFNPIRLGITLLVISRPRPMQNLFVYWVGCVIASVLFLLVPLILLHATPLLGSFADDLATPTTSASATARHVQVVLGLLVLGLATLLVVRSVTHRRSARLSGVTHSPPPDAPSLADGGTAEPAAGESGMRRWSRRAHAAWADGALWVALVIGIFTGPGIDGALYVLAIVVPSGSPAGAQFAAAVVFIILMLGIVEITLVSHLIAPARTHAVVQTLHDWTKAHGRKLVVAMLAVIGAAMVAQGVGAV